MRLAYLPYSLRFRHPAGTSRGVLTEKPTYLLKLFDERDPAVFGLGEASLFPGLSLEADSRYEFKIVELLANVAIGKQTDLSRYPSLLFGFEQAMRDFASGGRGIYFQSGFTEGKKDILINGLVWMGSVDEMLARVKEKIESGFTCVKFKVGALDWNAEFDMIKAIRREYGELEIRLDANGGFPDPEALERLKRLHPLDIHSIEQPVKPGNPDLMAFLCRESPVPIALDESLIGMNSTGAKQMLLDYIAPQYIILKPSLCGGFSGAEEWISLANERNIGWWVTSALESNIGLNALSQWVGSLNVSMPQGLGTGQLFTNNFPSPLRLVADRLEFDPSALSRDIAQLDSLPWRL